MTNWSLRFVWGDELDYQNGTFDFTKRRSRTDIVRVRGTLTSPNGKTASWECDVLPNQDGWIEVDGNIPLSVLGQFTAEDEHVAA
jgi:hypothetical protein